MKNIKKIDIFVLILIQLKKLREYQVAESYTVLKATTACWRSLAELNGYLKAIESDISNAELKLFHICEARSALEMDGYNIAYIRIFEAYASENNLHEPTAQLIFEMANIAQNLRHINSSALSLNFPFTQNSKRGIAQLPLLKKEINQYLDNSPDIDAMLYLGLLHGYIAMRKIELKYPLFLANTIINHWMREKDMLQLPILPLALLIKSSSKEADGLLKEAFETGDMQKWILYFLNLVGKAADSRLEQLRNIVRLKRSTREIISKYTLYPLPADELMEILFEKPFIKAKDITGRLECHRQTAYAYLSHLELSGILVEKKSGREKLYFHKKLFEILISEQDISLFS